MLRKEDYSEYLYKTYSSWLGKLIGIRLGAPVEGWSSDKIEEVYHGRTGYLVDYDIFASDDDSNGPLFFVRSLEEHKELLPQDVGTTMLAYIQEYSGFFWWGGVGVSTEHTAYENLKNGIEAPKSGSKEQNGIETAEQIGGQIFSDCWGYVNGYDTERAGRMAAAASSVTHDGDGIQGGIFVATAISLAYRYRDIHAVVKDALEFLDHTCEYYRIANIIIDFYEQHPENWQECLRFIQQNYGYDKYPGVCHIIPNMCVMIMAMFYGENDFDQTLTICNRSGWDTDCNCGNVGSIIGALTGVNHISSSWIEPIGDIINSSSCVGYLNIQTVSQTAKYFTKLAFALDGIEIEDNGIFDLPYAVQGFRCRDHLSICDGLYVKSREDVYRYAYYLPDDIYDARYDPAFSPLVYPGDVVHFILFGNDTEVQLFAEDCEGKKDYSKAYRLNGKTDLSLQIQKGINRTIRRYGIKWISGSTEYLISDVKIEHQYDLELDFKNYPIDSYGPRYAGDKLDNIRGMVVHSGKWKIMPDGLFCTSTEHALISTGCDCRINSIEAEIEVLSGSSAMIVFGMKNALDYQAIGYENGSLVISTIRDKKTISEKICKLDKKFKILLKTEDVDVTITVFIGKTVKLPLKPEMKGLFGFCCSGESNVIFNHLKVN